MAQFQFFPWASHKSRLNEEQTGTIRVSQTHAIVFKQCTQFDQKSYAVSTMKVMNHNTVR